MSNPDLPGVFLANCRYLLNYNYLQKKSAEVHAIPLLLKPVLENLCRVLHFFDSLRSKQINFNKEKLRHFLILLIVGLVTLTIVFIIYRPDLIEKVWLWAIGLAGPAIMWVRKIIDLIQKRFLPKVKSITRIPKL